MELELSRLQAIIDRIAFYATADGQGFLAEEHDRLYEAGFTDAINEVLEIRRYDPESVPVEEIEKLHG